MAWKSMTGYVILPALLFASYFACLHFSPPLAKQIFHTERGTIEMGTAFSFTVASCIAAWLFFKTRAVVAGRFRVLYCMFAIAGLFVALEELSYGQKLFHWNSPEWFAENNLKSETNLHNMFGSKPSNRLRAIATIGCPICCIVLPVIRRARQGYRPGEWAYYLLPRYELAAMTVLTILLTVFNKIPSIKGMATWTGHLGEFKELYWGIIAACYAGILSRRLLMQKRSSNVAAPESDERMHFTDSTRRAA